MLSTASHFRLVPPVSFAETLTFGALVSATDPVSVKAPRKAHSCVETLTVDAPSTADRRREDASLLGDLSLERRALEVKKSGKVGRRETLCLLKSSGTHARDSRGGFSSWRPFRRSSCARSHKVGDTLEECWNNGTQVIAVFTELRVHPKMFYLLFGESVLNDAVGIVLFKTFAKYVGREPRRALHVWCLAGKKRGSRMSGFRNARLSGATLSFFSSSKKRQPLGGGVELRSLGHCVTCARALRVARKG